MSSDCCINISAERDNDWCKAKCFDEDGNYNDECAPENSERNCDCLCPDKSIRKVEFIVAHTY